MGGNTEVGFTCCMVTFRLKYILFAVLKGNNILNLVKFNIQATMHQRGSFGSRLVENKGVPKAQTFSDIAIYSLIALSQ